MKDSAPPNNEAPPSDLLQEVDEVAKSPPKLRMPKGPAYVRVSITDRCNLRCKYCMPERGVELSKRKEHATVDEHVDAIARLADTVGVRKIRLTGGEPLVRKDVVEFVQILHDRFPEAELTMTTNAVLLDRLAEPLKAAGLERVNISLDTVHRGRFAEVTRRDEFNAVVRGIDAANDAGLTPVKFNVVLLKSLNLDELGELVRFAAQRDCFLRFIELMVVGEAGFAQAKEFLSAEDALAALRKEFPIRDLEFLDGVARKYMVDVDGREHPLGFVQPVSHPFCDTCDRMRVDTLGRIHSCLMAEDPRDAKDPAALYRNKKEPKSSWKRDGAMSNIGG